MEQPRYRAGPGGGSGTAWSGTCGATGATGATEATRATGATGATRATGLSMAGDDEDESGECNMGVPEPRTVPKPEGVPSFEGVPSPEGVPNFRDVPSPRDVLNPEGVSNSGSVSSPSSVTNTRSVPTPGSVPKPGSVPNSGSVSSPSSVPNTTSVPNTGSVTSPGGIPSPGSVPKPSNAPNPRSVPSPEGVPNPGGVSSPGSVPKLGGVPNPINVPNPANVPTVPSPGGRCSCRGPPASPPSPSRDLPCGLGCRHRPNPGDPGHKTPPNHHEEEKNTPNDTTGGHLRSLRAVTRAGIALSLRLLGALLALLFLLLLLLLGALRSFSRRVSSGFCHFQELLSSLRHPQSRLDVPKGGDNEEEEEVTRLVAMAGVAEEELDPFRVLGVEPTASDPELRRAYRRLAVLVHPDKSRDPRAEAAFKVLRAGWERVSSPERRRQYQTKQLAQGELARALSTFLGRLQEELRDAMDAMGCTRCGGRHRRFQLDRDPRGARYCGPCGGWHSAEEGDLWAESSLMGLKVTYLARMDGHIYDVTEWAGCQRVAISPDSHRVPYHLSFGARTATPAGRQRAPPKGSPPSPTELQDFLARVFQGNPGPGEPPGGAFPTPPGAAGSPQGPPQGQGGPPRGDTKHKRRKKGRRPLPR